MTKTDKIEIKKEIDRIVHKYPRPDSSELFRSELEYLVDVVKKSLQDTTEEREDICLRCGVERKEVKREGSNGCHSRGFSYPKHLWK